VNRASFLAGRLRGQLDRCEQRCRAGQHDVDPAESIYTLHTLYKELFTPLLGVITHPRLIIAPDGPLYSVPFQALFDGQSYLGDRYEISYTHSCSALRHNLQRSPITAENAIAFLPRMIDTVDASPVPHVTAFESLIGENAIAKRLRTEAPDAFQYVHIDADTQYTPHRPLFSGFKLAGEMVTALDLFSRLCECDLAALTGQQTGTSPGNQGEEFQVLTRALLYAGARSLLMGLWSTDGPAAQKLMGHFYQERRAGQRKSAALQIAARNVREEYPHPFNWAPFVLYGQG
jgi:CHAT domain-containing protein